MGIKGHNDIPRILKEMEEWFEQEVIEALSYAGEQALIDIRSRPSGKPNWTDRTGNLRSSIGYTIFYNGEEKRTGGFDTVNNKGSNPAEGISIGKQFVESLGINISSLYTLIVSAGMNYASHLEKKDYEVVMFVEDSTEKLVNELIEAKLNELEIEFKRRYG